MAIKVGDKVKATLGESVVVGEVLSASKGIETGRPYFEVRVSPNVLADITIWTEDGWTIEVIQDLPTKVGAVVRNNHDGTLYVRQTDNPHYDHPWIDFRHDPEAVWGDDTVTEGGFEILFGGVDE